MADRTCSIEGCEREFRARGLCASHYTLARRRGDLQIATKRPHDHEAVFKARTVRDLDTGCLLWMGAITDGYGRFQVNGRLMRTHRYAWERVNGPIPEGMLVDHSCHRRDCVEISHLRLATIAENGQNRSGPVPGSSTGVRNVHKKRGGFRAVVHKGGERVYGKTVPTLEQAAETAEKLREELFGEFAGRG